MKKKIEFRVKLLNLYGGRLWANIEHTMGVGSLAIRMFNLWIQFGWGWSQCKFDIDYYGKNYKWQVFVDRNFKIDKYFQKIVRVS